MIVSNMNIPYAPTKAFEEKLKTLRYGNYTRENIYWKTDSMRWELRLEMKECSSSLPQDRRITSLMPTKQTAYGKSGKNASWKH